jgi:hypothetical protein
MAKRKREAFLPKYQSGVILQVEPEKKSVPKRNTAAVNFDATY